MVILLRLFGMALALKGSYFWRSYGMQITSISDAKQKHSKGAANLLQIGRKIPKQLMMVGCMRCGGKCCP